MPDPTLTRYFAYDAEVDGDGTYVTFEEADRLIQASREQLAQMQQHRDDWMQFCRHAEEDLSKAQAEVQALRQQLEEARASQVIEKSRAEVEVVALRHQHGLLRDWLTIAVDTLDEGTIIEAIDDFLEADASNLAGVGAHPEANYAVDPIAASAPRESLRAYRLKIQELTAEVGALRRALDAAQPETVQCGANQHGRDFSKPPVWCMLPDGHPGDHQFGTPDAARQEKP